MGFFSFFFWYWFGIRHIPSKLLKYSSSIKHMGTSEGRKDSSCCRRMGWSRDLHSTNDEQYTNSALLCDTKQYRQFEKVLIGWWRMGITTGCCNLGSKGSLVFQWGVKSWQTSLGIPCEEGNLFHWYKINYASIILKTVACIFDSFILTQEAFGAE